MAANESPRAPARDALKPLRPIIGNAGRRRWRACGCRTDGCGPARRGGRCACPVNGAPPPLPGPITAAEAGNNDLAPPSSDSPYRVLIVEDDRAQALFAQSVLHGAGMQAIVHSDADGALQAIRNTAPT